MRHLKVWKGDQAFRCCGVKCNDTLDFAVTVGLWFVGVDVPLDFKCFMHGNMCRGFPWNDRSHQENGQADQRETKG